MKIQLPTITLKNNRFFSLHILFLVSLFISGTSFSSEETPRIKPGYEWYSYISPIAWVAWSVSAGVYNSTRDCKPEIQTLKQTLEATVKKLAEDSQTTIQRVAEDNENTVKKIIDVSQTTIQRLTEDNENTVKRIIDDSENTIKDLMEKHKSEVERLMAPPGFFRKYQVPLCITGGIIIGGTAIGLILHHYYKKRPHHDVMGRVTELAYRRMNKACLRIDSRLIEFLNEIKQQLHERYHSDVIQLFDLEVFIKKNVSAGYHNFETFFNAIQVINRREKTKIANLIEIQKRILQEPCVTVRALRDDAAKIDQAIEDISSYSFELNGQLTDIKDEVNSIVLEHNPLEEQVLHVARPPEEWRKNISTKYIAFNKSLRKKLPQTIYDELSLERHHFISEVDMAGIKNEEALYRSNTETNVGEPEEKPSGGFLGVALDTGSNILKAASENVRNKKQKIKRSRN